MNEIVSVFGHIVGFIGMLFVVVAFYATVAGRWVGTSMIFNGVNLVGAVLLLISLLIHFNLGSFIIEVFWILISIKGLTKREH